MVNYFRKKILQPVRNTLAAQGAYFSEYGQEIAVRNLELMRTVSLLGIILYIAYYTVTVLFFRPWSISLYYALIVPVLFVFLFYTRGALRENNVQTDTALNITTLMYAVVMAEMILLSVFPHPNVPSVFFPLFLLVGPVMFLLPVRRQLLITVSGFAVFFVLVLRFKSPQCWPHELFEAATSLALSVVVIILMTQLRVQGETLKNEYYLMSRLDGLTGILNKTAGLSLAQKYLQQKNRPEQFAVLFIDIDNFKQINDTCGHVEGDRLLKEIGSVLQSTCRKKDIVCRYGGDEFLILLKDMLDADVSLQKAKRIQETISSLPDQSRMPPTCSIGICFVAKSEQTIDQYITVADHALYQAKANGKNSCFLLAC